MRQGRRTADKLAWLIDIADKTQIMNGGSHAAKMMAHFLMVLLITLLEIISPST
jgi:hypothetical protein